MSKFIKQNGYRPGMQGSGKPGDLSVSQYVTFRLDDAFFGIDIIKVREIKGWTEPHKLPGSPYAMRGVLNLRGVVVSVFDLRCRFGQGETQATPGHVVIIAMAAQRLVGILVDAVSDILTLNGEEVLPVPEMGQEVDQRFLSGLVNHDDQIVTLLNLEELFDLSQIPSVRPSELAA